MIEKESLRKLVSPFGVEVSELEFLQASQNVVYRITRGTQQSIVRVSKGRHRTESLVEAELQWIQFLVSQGINVCQPVPTLDGALCHSCEIDQVTHVVTCFEHAPGAQMSRQDANEKTFEKLGRLTGEMHQAASRFETKGCKVDRQQWDESRLLNEDFVEQNQHISERFKSSVRDLIHDLNQAHRSRDSFGMLHADINFINLFEDDGELWIFDFDNCEYGYFIQDLSTVLWDSIYARELNKFADDGLSARIKPLWQSFLKGYFKTDPSEGLDLSQLRKFFLLREAIIYVHFHQVIKAEDMDESFRRGLQVMRENVERQQHQVDFDFIS